MPPFGTVELPEKVRERFGTDPSAIGKLLNVLLNVMVVAGGIYAILNIILAGYAFMSAGDDPKKVQGAWNKIWQTLLGLAFVAGSFVLAAIFGQLLFGDPNAILSPKIKAP